MRSGWIGLALASTLACTSEAPGKKPLTAAPKPGAPAPIDTTQIDALWKLAPSDAEIGLVFSGEALVTLDGVVGRYRQVAESIPGSGDLLRYFDGAQLILRGSAASYPDAGVDLARGGALFLSGGKKLVIFPVVDRAKFVAAHGGTLGDTTDRIYHTTCAPREAFYACGDSAAVLAALGTGDLGPHAGVGGVRGSIEAVITEAASRSPATLVDRTGPARVVVELRRGELVIRAYIPGKPLGPLAALTELPARRVNLDDVGGFVVAPIGGFMRGLASQKPGALPALLHSLTGHVTLLVPAGASDVEARVPLLDPVPARALLARCGELTMAPGVFSDDTCHVGPLPPWDARFDVWVEGTDLRGGRARGTAPRRTARGSPTAIARELAGYSFASWGRGLYAVMGTPPLSDTQANLMGLNEVGVGATATEQGVTLLVAARTIHANPPAIAAALEEAIQAGGDVHAAFTRIAREHPEAPIAADAAAGPLAFPVPFTFGAGMTASVLIPATLEHMVEARRRAIFDPTPMLEDAARAAKVYFMTHGKFPVGDASWRPTSPCCGQPGDLCAADPAQFDASAIWRELGVRVDVPQPFGFSYRGKATSFSLKVEGDLDCDRKTFTKIWMHGRVENGGPVVEISRSDE